MKNKKEQKKVLFICTHNSARSQIAEGLMNTFFGDDYIAWSAGIEPTQVNPYAIKVMEEVGIDVTGHHSKGMESFLDQDFDYVITVCDHANEACPYFPGGKERIHKGFEDPTLIEGPEEAKLSGFRRARDKIKAWLEEFCSPRHG
ncbi:MAG: arsenate reductase ArsC [Deltaproteobacteria bacterium]|nr:arsenate reductase ArsC [Deltaproteobacteria bacterium]